MEYKNLFGGNDRMKKVGGYPSPYVSPEEKEKKEYGLAYFKRMFYDWKNNSEINIDSRRAMYTKARSYAQGAQDTRKYKETMSELTTNLASLNTVYGNMLSAMNVNG